jgi:6-phospho-beta-glucosidase
VRVSSDAGDPHGEEVLPALLSDEKFIASTHMAMFDPVVRKSLKMFLNEYLHYFYQREEALATLMAKPETRGEEVIRLTNKLLAELQEVDAAHHPQKGLEVWREIMGQRSESYMAHARHGAPRPRMAVVEGDDEGYAAVALGCVQAIATGVSHFSGLNVPNDGAIQGMEPDDVVEVSCVIDTDGPHPIQIGEIPEGPYLLMRDVKHYERLASQAILQRSRELAIEALATHPLIGSFTLAKSLVADFLEAHKDLVGQWN